MNDKNTQTRGTMRIFLAPKFDEQGKEFTFSEIRRLMIEMDRFTVNCKFNQHTFFYSVFFFKLFIKIFILLIVHHSSKTCIVHPGENVIRRKSTESAVTIPYEQTFRNIDKDRPGNERQEQQERPVVTRESHDYDFCGCGWPHHMLIPMGCPESDNGGFACQLFAMVSNYDDDRVEQSLTGSCTNAVAYCGIRDRLYPDKRNMGFPFDRKATKNDGSLQEFVLPNMKVVDCKIIFKDITVQKASQGNVPTDVKNKENELN